MKTYGATSFVWVSIDDLMSRGIPTHLKLKFSRKQLELLAPNLGVRTEPVTNTENRIAPESAIKIIDLDEEI